MLSFASSSCSKRGLQPGRTGEVRWPCSTLSNRDSPRRNTLSQRTFSIIKPDAVRKGYTAAILAEIEKAGFKIVGIKKIAISKSQAEGFYAVHSARPFFDSLTTFMSSGS